MRFKQVDVFSTAPCYGNPLAVVLDARGLTHEMMQRVARWTNLSETAFVFDDEQADYFLRIYSPDRELPFAGHPVVGAAHAVIEAGIVDSSGPFTMRCELGILTLRCEGRKIWVQVPPPKLLGSSPEAKSLSSAIPGGTLIDPLVFDTGPVWMVARMNSKEELINVQADRDELIELSRTTNNAVGIVLYALNDEGGIEVRALAPAAGVDEDPVCGSGNLAAAAHLKETGILSRLGMEYVARQGRHLERDGFLSLSVGEDCFELGGEALTVIDGRIKL